MLCCISENLFHMTELLSCHANTFTLRRKSKYPLSTRNLVLSLPSISLPWSQYKPSAVSTNNIAQRDALLPYSHSIPWEISKYGHPDHVLASLEPLSWLTVYSVCSGSLNGSTSCTVQWMCVVLKQGTFTVTFTFRSKSIVSCLPYSASYLYLVDNLLGCTVMFIDWATICNICNSFAVLVL